MRLVFREVVNAEHELHLRFSCFRNDNFLRLSGKAFVPGLQLIRARRNVGEVGEVPAVGGCRLKRVVPVLVVPDLLGQLIQELARGREGGADVGARVAPRCL